MGGVEQIQHHQNNPMMRHVRRLCGVDHQQACREQTHADRLFRRAIITFRNRNEYDTHVQSRCNLRKTETMPRAWYWMDVVGLAKNIPCSGLPTYRQSPAATSHIVLLHRDLDKPFNVPTHVQVEQKYKPYKLPEKQNGGLDPSLNTSLIWLHGPVRPQPLILVECYGF